MNTGREQQKKEPIAKSKIKILTPTIVATGEKLEFGQVLSKKQNNSSSKNPFYKIYIADFSKIIKKMGEKEKIKEFFDRIQKTYTTQSYDPIIASLIENNYQYEINGEIHEEIRKSYMTHIKVNNQVYVPGSSIKGSILTAIYNYALKDLSKQNTDIMNTIVKVLEKNMVDEEDDPSRLGKTLIDALVFAWISNPRKALNLYNKIVSSYSKRKHNHIKSWLNKEKFLPWLIIRDTNLMPPSEALIARLIQRIYLNSPSKKIEFYSETLRPDLVFDFELKKQKENHLSIKEILEITDKHYKEVLEKERQWFQKSNLRNVVFPTPSKNGYLIRIGFGSGVYSTTLLPLAHYLEEEEFYRGLVETYVKKHRLAKKVSPVGKTRFVAHGYSNQGFKIFYPLGWAEIQLSTPNTS